MGQHADRSAKRRLNDRAPLPGADVRAGAPSTPGDSEETPAPARVTAGLLPSGRRALFRRADVVGDAACGQVEQRDQRSALRLRVVVAAWRGSRPAGPLPA